MYTKANFRHSCVWEKLCSKKCVLIKLWHKQPLKAQGTASACAALALRLIHQNWHSCDLIVP